MRVPNEEVENVEPQMGPLIDCVFLLLIFFIVIAVTKKSIKELGIQLPETAAKTYVKPKDKDLVIRVRQDGEIWVGSTQVGQQGLLEAVRAAAKENPDTKVRIEADRRAQVQHLMPIWTWLNQYGLTNVGMRAKMD